MLIIHKIEARDLPDLWFQAVYDILEHGRQFVIDRGSYAGQTRLEYDYFIGHVLNPGHGSGTPEILPDIPPAVGIPNPVTFEYVYVGEGDEARSYVEYVMSDTKQPGESYTYGERLTRWPVGLDMWEEVLGVLNGMRDDIHFGDRDVLDKKVIVFDESGLPHLNQIEYLIRIYKKYGPRNNQMVLQIAKPDDSLLLDPPCLRQIDTRIQDDTLHFVVYFRSWDLWGGLPANLAGIQTLKEYMAGEIGVKDGEMIVESKGLHLYGYAEDLAKLRCLKE